VLLHRNASVPWLILVPETDYTNLLDLPETLRNLAIAEAAVTARFIKSQFGLNKINFAAIGNVVPQLHLHVVGRSPDDPCWPAPIWGHLVELCNYSTAHLATLEEVLVRDYSLTAI
jgi:diadenosine tetraphosphate (Ap4A) HIT family hydrolase